MNYVVVKFNYDYADEFDVKALWFTTFEQYNAIIKNISKLGVLDLNYYFGTNECIEIEHSKELIDCLSFYVIDSKTFETMTKILGSTFGNINLPDLFNFILNEE